MKTILLNALIPSMMVSALGSGILAFHKAALLADMSDSDMIRIIVRLVIFACIVGGLWWLIDYCVSNPQLNKAIHIVFNPGGALVLPGAFENWPLTYMGGPCWSFSLCCTNAGSSTGVLTAIRQESLSVPARPPAKS